MKIRDALIVITALTLLMVSFAAMAYTTGYQPGDDPATLWNGSDKTPTPTVTPTPTATTTTTTQPTTTTRVPFDPIVTYETCERVRVGGTGVTYVAVLTENGVTKEWRGNATNTSSKVFETKTGIKETYVAGPTDEASYINEYYDACFVTTTPEPTPTPTLQPTTQRTTTTTTPTPTTRTMTTTTTTTATTTTEPASERKMELLDLEESLGTNATAEGRIWNTHEYAVSGELFVTYWSDWNIKADVQAVAFTADANEEVPFMASYEGNESIEKIEYEFYNVEKSNE